MKTNKLTAIIRGATTPVSKYFNMHELRCRSANAPKVYYIPNRLLNILDYIREITKTPINPSSAGRTKEHNGKTAGSATNSQHVIDENLTARAIDFQFANNNEELIVWLRDQVTSNSSVWREMRLLGCRGIGFYDSFIHIDVRKGVWAHNDGIGTFAMWNEQKVLKKKVSKLSVLKTLSSTLGYASSFSTH